MSYKGNCEIPTIRGISVTCANGGQLVSTATDDINFHGLPPAATRCHKFPNNKLVDPLISLGKLTDHGCQAIFKKDTVEVTNKDGLLILVGQKPVGRNIYTVTLPLGHRRPNVPQTLTVLTVPKNSGIMHDTHRVVDTRPATRPATLYKLLFHATHETHAQTHT